jgi:hypothetical protein
VKAPHAVAAPARETVGDLLARRVVAHVTDAGRGVPAEVTNCAGP